MDPIADFLTRIRNANSKGKDRVDIPFSNIKFGIAKILKEEGFIANHKTLQENKKTVLRVFLKFTPEKGTVIQGIRRMSRPGLRVYRSYSEIPKVRGGAFGVSILSTPQGIMTDAQAKEKKVGGEILCQVW